MAEAKLGGQRVASTVLSRLDSASAIPASLASLSLGFSARKKEARDPAVSLCQAQARAQSRGHLHGGQVREAEAQGRSVCAGGSDSTAPLLTGSHDNSASCHPGADGVRHFRIRLLPGPGPRPGRAFQSLQ